MRKTPARLNAYDPRVDGYIAQAPEFAQPVLTHIRDLMHKTSPEIEETIKWTRPFFVHHGELLGNMAAFKEHCSFGFWATEMAAVLREDGIDGSEASGSFGRLTSVKDLPPPKVLLRYMHHAVELAESGKGRSLMSPRERVKKVEAVVPPDLLKALEAEAIAKANFAMLSPSCRREYIEWIVEAKRVETRERRMAKTVEQLREGKSLNSKYA